MDLERGATSGTFHTLCHNLINTFQQNVHVICNHTRYLTRRFTQVSPEPVIYLFIIYYLLFFYLFIIYLLFFYLLFIYYFFYFENATSLHTRTYYCNVTTHALVTATARYHRNN